MQGYGRGETYALELGNDLSRAIGSEFAMLASPQTLPLFVKKYQQRRLKQYRRREPVYKGMATYHLLPRRIWLHARRCCRMGQGRRADAAGHCGRKPAQICARSFFRFIFVQDGRISARTIFCAGQARCRRDLSGRRHRLQTSVTGGTAAHGFRF